MKNNCDNVITFAKRQTQSGLFHWKFAELAAATSVQLPHYASVEKRKNSWLLVLRELPCRSCDRYIKHNVTLLTRWTILFRKHLSDIIHYNQLLILPVKGHADIYSSRNIGDISLKYAYANSPNSHWIRYPLYEILSIHSKLVFEFENWNCWKLWKCSENNVTRSHNRTHSAQFAMNYIM